MKKNFCYKNMQTDIKKKKEKNLIIKIMHL